MKKELKQTVLNSVEDCFSLKGKSALVIGGGGKMSESFSDTLLSAGCSTLILSDINGKKINSICKKSARNFKNTTILGRVCDISNKNEVLRLTQFISKQNIKLDILIYAVMSKPEGYYAPFSEYPFSTWEKTLHGNLSGAFLATQNLISFMNHSSSIILISTIYALISPDFRLYKDAMTNIYGGKYPLTSPAVYSASKAGLVGLGRYLAVHLANKDIRVNILVPGGVYDGQDESFYREYIKRVPLRRMAVWSDFNGAILFLASDASRYMTGQTLIIDGGMSAW